MEPRILQKRSGCRGVVNGKEIVIFSSNDYLGLSCHPEVIRAASKAAGDYGIGTGGAPGTTGTTDLHQELSKAIAAFKSRDKAVLFPSGYQANIAIHHALASPDTVFHLDKRHHPSAVDGARLGVGSKLNKFDHINLENLEKSLKFNSGKSNIVSLPSVFTVDADIAPLDRIAELKNRYEFILILDEAHATGCVGRTGCGLEEFFNLHGIADFIMGSFSKALGSQGGFVAYNNMSESRLKSGFRQLSYSTSLSTISVAAALKALQIFQNDAGIYSSLKKAKSMIIHQCHRRNIKITTHESMILLVPCDNLIEAIEKLLYDGFFVVPAKAYLNGQKQDCLRITPMSLHTESDINTFVNLMSKHVIQDRNQRKI
ncbi:MAG: aminotransferase class I/II-fold pyridoxal phosphate-dependent enzyme [Candidatus Zixiibacteriota bacterium]|nr:MAG: aminotransferase class I/II-fold pyridoxal phosphate-dependent enzyme [candidate division Zixibacteria bacterium]